MTTTAWRRIVWSRLLIGWVVLICAEVFSGASLGVGLWHPWTLVVTYWLYFSHFFLFTTLAVKTGRTSLGSLYLWGILFGLYESWVTKVIWYGYGGDGKLAMGRIGPYGLSEISMALVFHPVMSFLLPLAVACVMWPGLRRLFPDLAWLTGSSRWSRVFQAYLVIGFAPIVAMNSGGPLNLALNAACLVVVLLLLWGLAWPGVEDLDPRSIVVFQRRGLVGLCLYLAVLYGVTYPNLRPEGLPSAMVQLGTLLFYVAAGAGLVLKRPIRTEFDRIGCDRSQRLRTIGVVGASVLGAGFLLSFLRGMPGLFVPILLDFVLWSGLSLALPCVILVLAARERFWIRPGMTG
jgi:hypothetical protein